MCPAATTSTSRFSLVVVMPVMAAVSLPVARGVSAAQPFAGASADLRRAARADAAASAAGDPGAAGPPSPSTLRCRPRADGEGSRRDVLVDDRAGRGVGAVADRHRRDQHGVAADPDVVADDRAVLATPS